MDTEKKSPLIEGQQRVALMEELHKKYGASAIGPAGLLPRLRYWRKKYAWMIVVGGAKLLKRTFDVLGPGFLMLCLWPIFLVVTLCIKLTDGGPILFW